ATRCHVCCADPGGNRRHRRLPAIAHPRAAPGRTHRDAASRQHRPPDARLPGPRDSRHGRKLRPAIACRRRRHHRIKLIVSRSWLYFANRLIELPLGMVGVAMGTVLIPELTRALQGNDKTAIASAESRALELAVGLALPATLGLAALSEPIVRLLFEHGAFTAEDTHATAQALIWLALGLPAHVLVKAL